MIDSLTPAQEAKIPEYVDKFLKIGMSTEPMDIEAAKAAITASYAHMKLPAPEFVIADSPFAGAKLAAQLEHGREEVTRAEVQAQNSSASYGSFEAYWVSFYSFCFNELNVPKNDLINIVEAIVKNCGVYWTFKDLVVLTHKPIAIHMVDKKLHNPNGMALEYRDGTGLYCIDGVAYDSLMDAAVSDWAKEQNDQKDAG